LAVRRLRDYQAVSLYVGDACVAARVASVHGDEACLAAGAPLPPEAGFLPASAQLAFTHDGRLVVLAGELCGDGEALRFVVGDGVRATDLRRHTRLSVGFAAVATPLTADGSPAGAGIPTTTLDLSAGGALLACGGLDGRLRVAIDLPGEGGRIEGVAIVTRAAEDWTAIEFAALPADQRSMLDRLVTSVRTELARRFAVTGA
jgi:hypothetical protein